MDINNRRIIDWASIIEQAVVNPTGSILIEEDNASDSTIRLRLNALHRPLNRRDETVLSRATFAAATTVVSVHDGNMSPCPVCRVLLRNGSGDASVCCRPVTCVHIFHRRCLSRWCMEYDTRCPICRQEIRPT